MGAPGYIILCKTGHEIGIIEDDLFWDEDMSKILEDLEKKKCPICGDESKYRFCHYGSINDCICTKLTWNGKEKRWIFPIELSEDEKEELESFTIKRNE